MKDQMNTKGFNFHMMALDNWIFDDGFNKLFDGSFASVMIYATTRGFRMEDLEMGVEMMLATNHDSIHFGMYKSPVFSFNRKENKKIA